MRYAINQFPLGCLYLKTQEQTLQVLEDMRQRCKSLRGCENFPEKISTEQSEGAHSLRLRSFCKLVPPRHQENPFSGS